MHSDMRIEFFDNEICAIKELFIIIIIIIINPPVHQHTQKTLVDNATKPVIHKHPQ